MRLRAIVIVSKNEEAVKKTFSIEGESISVIYTSTVELTSMIKQPNKLYCKGQMQRCSTQVFTTVVKQNDLP